MTLQRLAQLSTTAARSAWTFSAFVCASVLHVLEVVVALPVARGPAEVVERNRGVAALGEAQRELLVEAVEPADVRE